MSYDNMWIVNINQKFVDPEVGGSMLLPNTREFTYCHGIVSQKS